MRTRLGVALITAALTTLAAPAVATAAVPGGAPPTNDSRISGDDASGNPLRGSAIHPDDQHGPDEGHLPGSKENVELVGRVDIKDAAEGRVADVAAYGNFAYLTVRDPADCAKDKAGIAILNIANPAAPYRVWTIRAKPGSFPGEGAHVIDVNTASFKGQVLLFNNEICAEGGEGGVSLWDVTDPTKPKVLSENFGDPDPSFSGRFNTIHSAFGWQAGGRAYAVLTDNEESADVDIIEITNPRKPKFLTELDLHEFDIDQEEVLSNGNFQGSFLHDMVVKQINGVWTMLLSYWDGGYIQLNVNNPAKPTFISQSDFPIPDELTGADTPEGNAHQAEFSPGNRYIIGTDEDFSPYRIDPFLITTGPNAGEYAGGEFGFTVPTASLPGGKINGPTIYGGLGCPASYELNPPVPNASALTAGPDEEKVVVLQRGGCFFSEKIEQAQLAGYDAAIIANSHLGAEFGETPDAALCGSQGHEFTPTIPAICIGHRAFHLLFNTEPGYVEDVDDAPALGTKGEKVDATAFFDGWGYVRLLDRKTMEEVDSYAIKEALNPKFANGFGALSVHEVAVDPNQPGLAYLSYYAGGLRVIKYGRDGILEAGHYIAPEGNDFWGVQSHQLPGSSETLILASDRDSGLWIFKYTGG